MKYNPDIHHRQSIRLPNYNYSQTGAYFITICTHQRESLFGQITDGVMTMNVAGLMVDKWWHELTNKFIGIRLDAFVIMPNHIHGMLEIAGADLRVCPDNINGAQIIKNQGELNQGASHQGAHAGAPLHIMVQWFKTMTTNAYINGVKNSGWEAFNGRLWQRNYYEHIIRDESAYLNIAEYIRTNPQRWNEDVYHDCRGRPMCLP